MLGKLIDYKMILFISDRILVLALGWLRNDIQGLKPAYDKVISL